MSLDFFFNAEIVKSAASRSDNADDNETGLSHAIATHIVCCLDVLNATYDGLPAEAAQYAAKFQLLPQLHAILTAGSFDQRVSSRRQRCAVALLSNRRTVHCTLWRFVLRLVGVEKYWQR